MFDCVRMPFVLRNATQTFQRFTNDILSGFDFCYAYIGNILIASSNVAKYKQQLQLVFQRFKKYKVIVNPSKCELGVMELTFLGHTLNSQSVCPVQEKVTAVQEFSLPSTKRKLKEFLGLVNFYHHFIPHCIHVHTRYDSHTCRKNHLHKLFSPSQAIADVSLLAHPHHDVSTNIMTVASDIAVGAVLQQKMDDQWCPIAFFSKRLTPPKSWYSSFDRELLAVYLAIEYF